MVCRSPATIHHVHGESIVDRHVTRGGGQKTSHWLVIPLCPRHHTGVDGIDAGMGVYAWERKYGPQAVMVDQVGAQLGLDPWAKAESEKPALPKIFKRK